MFCGYIPLKLYKYGTLITFDKYEINVCSVIRHKKTKKIINKRVVNGYNIASVYDTNNRQINIRVSVAMLSSFTGSPRNANYTADHRVSRLKLDDRLINLRWADKRMQRLNQHRQPVQNNAFLISHANECKTVKEWSDITGLSTSRIRSYVHEKFLDWKYKIYEDIPGEEWKTVVDSENSQGYWMVSDMGRVAYHTKYTRKVYTAVELSKTGGYPMICINGKKRLLHIIVIQTFKPVEYKSMVNGDIILHNKDDRTDCRLSYLRIGNRSENGYDAHANHKYDGKKSQKRKCTAYNDIEKHDFDSITDAVAWLIENGFKNARHGNITSCLNNNPKYSHAYGYKWK
jgi:hypothetical protein